MDDKQLTAMFEERQAVVVHFSHHSNMREGGVFPDDLQQAIQNKDEWALSCSVLWPGHDMQPCGSVGVMFRPTVASVLSVSNADSGSFQGPGGADFSSGLPLSENTFQQTFDVVGSYNEWRVKGAEVIGIFVHDVDWIEVKKACQIPDPCTGQISLEIGSMRIGLAEVLDAFDDLPVYTMITSGLVRLDRR